MPSGPSFLDNSFLLEVTPETLSALRQLRRTPKFTDLPGQNTDAERRRCSTLIDGLLDRLIAGVEANPRKSWVLEQCVPTLEAVSQEDTEARERMGAYLEQIADILGIESSDGLFNHYLT